MPKDEYAIVLDFLPEGYPTDTRPSHLRKPVAQVITEQNFVLLEVIPKEGVTLELHERVYIGEGVRDKIKHIKRRLTRQELTPAAEGELKYVVEKLVEKNEKRFIEFFNKAGPITPRLHALELLPGIGKQHMKKIIEEREKKPFESFEDIKKRLKLIPDPKKMVVERILKELTGETRYYIFTPKFKKKPGATVLDAKEL